MTSPTREASRKRGTHRENVLTVRVAGLPIIVAGLSRRLFEHLSAILRPFREPLSPVEDALRFFVRRGMSERGERQWTITRDDGTWVGAYSDLQVLLTQLEWHVIAAGLSASTRHAVFHAAALARDDAALVLIGASGAGKSTLTLGLLQRGWRPFGDDVLLVEDETLALTPFPRCFRAEGAVTRQLATTPQVELLPGVATFARPLTWAPRGLHSTAFACISRDPAQPALLSPLSQAEMAGMLLEAAIGNQMPRSVVARVAARMVAGARSCRRLNNGDLEQSLDFLESLAK